eukprot:TRINITY_DN6951_c0_g1_i2.p6 TRINITY_DN6951_c0_g1~~TRINITY_DN6951_c0_g1_i2.p6  ORF type:complete len:132 (+),score=16.29 TRINITY_DN6951_c0_g1_i2:183-578(+)
MVSPIYTQHTGTWEKENAAIYKKRKTNSAIGYFLQHIPNNINIIAHNADPIIKIIFLPNLSRAKVARNPKRNCETPISAVPTLAKCSPWDKSISWEQQYTAFIPVNCWNTTTQIPIQKTKYEDSELAKFDI